MSYNFTRRIYFLGQCSDVSKVCEDYVSSRRQKCNLNHQLCVLFFCFLEDARVILDLLTDLERRLAGHDVSSQVNFVTNKYREVMENQDTATSSTETQLPACHTRAKATNNSSDPGSSSSKPRTPLFSLNPLNVPVQLLSLKKPTQVPSSQT